MDWESKVRHVCCMCHPNPCDTHTGVLMNSVEKCCMCLTKPCGKHLAEGFVLLYVPQSRMKLTWHLASEKLPHPNSVQPPRYLFFQVYFILANIFFFFLSFSKNIELLTKRPCS